MLRREAIKLKNLIYNFMKPQSREELKEVARQYGANKENFEYEVSFQEGSTAICFFKIIIGSSWERKTGGYQRLHRQANLQAINDLSSSKPINIEYTLQFFIQAVARVWEERSLQHSNLVWNILRQNRNWRIWEIKSLASSLVVCK